MLSLAYDLASHSKRLFVHGLSDFCLKFSTTILFSSDLATAKISFLRLVHAHTHVIKVIKVSYLVIPKFPRYL